jgi:hypothetical protein
MKILKNAVLSIPGDGRLRIRGMGSVHAGPGVGMPSDGIRNAFGS